MKTENKMKTKVENTLPVVAVTQTTKPNRYPKLEKHFQRLIQKFDRLSPEGKQKMIDSFGRVRQQLRAESDEDLSDVVEETIEEMKSFFEQRLAATL